MSSVKFYASISAFFSQILHIQEPPPVKCHPHSVSGYHVIIPFYTTKAVKFPSPPILLLLFRYTLHP